MPNHVLAALAAIVFTATVAIAATGPSDRILPCITVADDLAAIAGSPIVATVYHGNEAQAFLAAVLSVTATPLADLSRTVSIAVLKGLEGPLPATPETAVHIRFFGADGCLFAAYTTDHAGLALTLDAMAEGV